MAAADEAKFNVLVDSVYDHCWSIAQLPGNENITFSQRDLLETGLIPGNDNALLGRIIQRLMNSYLFAARQDDHGYSSWAVRSIEDAQDFLSLPTPEDRIVYDQIVQSHADGVWLRTIHQKTGLHDHTITTAIKRLEAKHLIKSLRSVEAKNKRMYIKATVAPSERATGGVWFTDQDLDVAFIDLLYKVVLKYVTDESTYRSSSSSGSGSGAADGRTKAPRKGVVRGGVGSGASGDAGGPSTDAAGGGGNRKRKATDLDSATATSARQHSTSSTQHHRSQAGYTLLPLPAGYTGYPTVRQIAQFIARTGITTNTTLSVADVQQLVDVLVWDGKLEKVRIKPAPAPQTAAPHSSVPLAAGGGRRGAMPATPTGQSTASTAASAVEQFGYRAVLAAVAPRGVVGGPGKAVPLVSAVAGVPAAADSEQQQDQAWARSNGLTEVPCGRCPVFDECEVGGPVSPIGCVYFAEWLGLRRAAKSDLEVF